MTEFHTLNQKQIFKELNTSDKGLSEREAKKRLEEFGLNELQQKKQVRGLKIFLRQFTDFLIILLLIATAISLFLKEYIDAIAMFSIVILSAALGFFQEYNAEKAIEALRKISAPMAKVIREGKVKHVKASQIVPGDILELESGDIIPADARLIEASSVQIDEASLTGESVPSKKHTNILKPGLGISDQENMAFMSTIVTYGKATAVVTNTGMKTELGKIAESLQSTKETSTPLQIKFGKLAKQIGMAVIFLIIIVFITGFFKGGIELAELFIFSLSLAVAAVPSSLPAIVTIGLSLGTKTLAKKNMIIKKLPAAESLGSATFICSDKTGTLTKNQMTITKIYTDNTVIDVSGSGYEPKGTFSVDNKEQNPKKYELLLRIGALCNNAKLTKENNKYAIVGDPTEGSLVVLAEKGKFIDSHHKFVEELPFDSDRKRMSVIFQNKSKKEAYVKGAPDLLLEKCTKVIINGKVSKLTSSYKKKLLEKNKEFAEQALRVLGLAYKEVKSKKYTIDNIESDLIFVGMVGMIDPARPEVKESIERCKKAGIQVIVITGDHAITAKAVGEHIGLVSKDDLILTGADLDKMSDSQLEKKINKIRIIARALPIQKSRIVDILQKKGHVVAMTGDGVNDAPALKKADIGIAMGITGTDVAKEVSGAILVDDNFATIVNAISEGRNIYDKIIKSTRYLLSCNMGEIVSVFIAIILNFPLPLIPLQILLMNLVTDGLPAIGLGFEPGEKDIMDRHPKDPKQNPVTGNTLALILIFGILMGIGTLFLFNRYHEQDLTLARTIAFTTLVMFEMFAVVGSRSLKAFRKLNPLTNKWLLIGVLSSIAIQILVIYWSPLQPIFGTVHLSLMHWLQILGISSIGFFVMELSKLFLNVKDKNNN